MYNMGKTYRRNGQYRPKKKGKVFVKDDSWKKNKHKKTLFPDNNSVDESSIPLVLPLIDDNNSSGENEV